MNEQGNGSKQSVVRDKIYAKGRPEQTYYMEEYDVEVVVLRPSLGQVMQFREMLTKSATGEPDVDMPTMFKLLSFSVLDPETREPVFDDPEKFAELDPMPIIRLMRKVVETSGLSREEIRGKDASSPETATAS